MDVYSLAAIGTNIFAGTTGGGVFLSTNNGTSWTAENNGLSSAYIGPLAVIGTNLFAGTEYGVFLTTNNGTSWTAVNNGLTHKSAYALAVDGTNLFAGTDSGGVFLSTNMGSTWTSVNDGMSDITIWTLASDGSNLFAGTVGLGVWRRPLSDMVTAVEDYSGYHLNDFFLYQNYPNPFNPSTTMSYVVPKESFVTIKVYDLLGREIKTLINEEEPAGKYSVTFTAGNLSSGIYLYSITAGSFHQTKKMVLLK